ncbi:mitochondrial inner membrane protein required for protein import [Paraconiothyrium brasiliense]|uniref:Mitochondrial import inner membrane translocase subunit TIM50 n=1 Tax=Paraconiothyrium brasiliense TaxID=300254 RepID=A0ABR3QW35_9PLEO
MLSRAATRAFKGLRTAPALPIRRIAPIASTPQRIRFYAAKHPQNDTFKSTKATNDPVHPKEQSEFDTSASPEQNTTPSGQPGQPAEEAPQQPQKPLPDLRHGIPSTFGAEFGGAEAKSQKGEHDPNNITDDPGKEPGPGREGGELPKSAYETSTDRRRNKVANWSYIAFALAATTGGAYLCRNWESEEEEKKHADAPSGWTPTLMYQRAKARLNGEMSYYTEPTFNKLLPEVEMMPPLTLVLSLEDLLVHSEWTTKHGWRTAKRPGVDYFLRYLSQYYELVIFTSAKSMDADPIIRKLDPYRIVMWPLFREATRYEKGEYIKDLSHLNRDLSRTIIIDTDPSHVKAQPENAIILPKWKGQPGDKGLVSLIPFLEYLAMLQQGGGNFDVRQALKSMEGKEIPEEFARREAKLRAEHLKSLEAEKAKKGKNLGSFVGALGLGNKQGQMVLADGTNMSEGLAQGKMMIDMFREIGRKQYETMDKEIRENGEKWLKEMAEEEKKFQEEQMKNMKSGAMSWFGGSAAAPAPQPPPSGAPTNEAGKTS